MGKAEILVVKEEVLMLKEGGLMLKEEVFMEVNVVKDVVKAVAENSITKAVFTKGAITKEVFTKAAITKAVMDSIVAHPIAIGRMC